MLGIACPYQKFNLAAPLRVPRPDQSARRVAIRCVQRRTLKSVSAHIVHARSEERYTEPR
jgi:hypothetical protein